MCRVIAISLLAWTTLVASTRAQGKDSPDDLVRKMLAQLEKLHATLAAIKTDEAAKAAHPEIKSIVAEIVALRKQAEKLPPPARDLKDLLAKEYRAKFVAVQEKLTVEAVRVRTFPSGREILTEVSALLAGKEVKTKDKEKGKSKDGS